jgi:hypothetical protein
LTTRVRRCASRARWLLSLDEPAERELVFEIQAELRT